MRVKSALDPSLRGGEAAEAIHFEHKYWIASLRSQ
jgi:hypothetical protein